MQTTRRSQFLIKAEKNVVEHMLSSLTVCLLQSRITPSSEQVMHHFELACEKVGLVATEALAIRILTRVSRKINKSHSMLELIGRGADQLQ